MQAYIAWDLANHHLGPLLRDRSCDPFRWTSIEQEGKEEAQGVASRHFRS
jgi:hypothetical protein